MIWKLLRQHISLGQLIGFGAANLAGMLIVLIAFQMYRDIMPALSGADSFMSPDYLIISKKNAAPFSADELKGLEEQTFVKNTGAFLGAEYRVEAQMGVEGKKVMSTELFLESVPDSFIDIALDQWSYIDGGTEVPLILPRSYISMYNFGLAKKWQLPKITDALAGIIDFTINIQGDKYKGKVVGFSNRLNTILVPETFMRWSNNRYARGDSSDPSRLIVKVDNPADENIARYINDEGYTLETGNLNAGKTAYFLKIIVTVVIAVGLVITILSFYILMLSIFLLVQKNADKLENLLLIGYTPVQVARPYYLLTIGLNGMVLLLALAILTYVRGVWLNMLYALIPDIEEPSPIQTVVLGLLLLLIVSVVNIMCITRKVVKIWKHRD